MIGLLISEPHLLQSDFKKKPNAIFSYKASAGFPENEKIIKRTKEESMLTVQKKGFTFERVNKTDFMFAQRLLSFSKGSELELNFPNDTENA